MKKRMFPVLVFFTIIALIGLSRESYAAPYYEGKVLKVIVGHSVGGGYDRLARLIGKHLPKHIPGKPSIVVENMPGAQSMIAANYLYNISKPDGLTIGTIDRGLPFAQLLKLDGVKFDIRKYAWIGSAASEVMILALRADLPYRTVEDLLKVKEPIPLAGVGAGASDTHFPVLLKEFCGMNFKMITYPASAESILAIERKEVDGRAGSYSSLKPYIERGMMRPFVRCRVSEPGLENLPVNENLTTNKTGKAIMAMLASADRVGRPYVAPPKTSPELMAILTQGFTKLEKDQKFQEDAKKIMMTYNYTPPGEVSQVLAELFSKPDDIIREFSKYIK